MYVVIVIVLLGLAPAGSVYAEQHVWHSAAPLMVLIGKWFTFWAVGARLFLAGLRQSLQPRFTAREIFGLKGEDALPIVRELGLANLSMGRWASSRWCGPPSRLRQPSWAGSTTALRDCCTSCAPRRASTSASPW